MITKIYRKHLISLSFIICHLSFSMMLASCAENANEWSVDESYSRLFRTTNLSLVETQPTAVVLSFNGVTSATQYVRSSVSTVFSSTKLSGLRSSRLTR